MEQITKKYKFSIITAVYNIAPFLGEAIDSVINQNIGFEENVQIILVNDGSTDNSGAICDEYKKKYPENIVVIHKENGGVSSARNEGLKHVEGQYVNFLDGDDKISANTLSVISRYFEKWIDIDVLTIPLVFFEGQKGNHILNNKFSKGSRVINVLTEYWYPLLFVNATFVRYEKAQEIHFDENLTTAEDAKVVTQLLLNTLCYGVVKEATYWYRRRISGAASAIQTSVKTKAWYINYMQHFAHWCVQASFEKMDCVPRFVQFTLMYDLQWRFRINTLPHDILTDEEIVEYQDSLHRLLQYIDDRIILDQKSIYTEHKLFILKYKYKCSPKLLFKNSDVNYYYKDTQICQQSYTMTRIEFMNIENDHLNLEGNFVCYATDLENGIEWFVKVNEQYIPCEINERKITIYSLDEEIAYRIGFSVSLELSKNENLNILFACKYQGHFVDKKKLDFGKFSPLQTQMPSSYYENGQYIVTYKKNKLIVKPYSKRMHFACEKTYLKALYRIKKPQGNKAIAVRIARRLWNLFPHKEFWIITDRVNKADDNGEALFRFMQKNPDSQVKCYFAIAKDSEDYERMKQYGKVIPFGGRLYKWLYICGAKIISSQGEDYVYRPLQKNSVYYSDIVHKNKFVFLQHGITDIVNIG